MMQTDLTDLSEFRKTVVKKADSLLHELNWKLRRGKEINAPKEVLTDLAIRKKAVLEEKKRILSELRKLKKEG